MKTIDFEVKSRGTTVPMPVWKYQDLFQIARELLEQEIVACGCAPLRLRLMGNVFGQRSLGRGKNDLSVFLC